MSDHSPHPREPDRDIWNSAGRGLIAGGIATVPMTAAMVTMHRGLPNRQRYPLPPREIVEDTLSAAELNQSFSDREKEILSIAAHFGYGSTLGAVYGILADRFRVAGLGGGIAFGLATWAGSYLGWLPALGMRAAATDESIRRNVLMIASHIVWGGALGFLHDYQQLPQKPKSNEQRTNVS